MRLIEKRGLLAGLFFVIFFAYITSPNITSFDSRWSIPTAVSMIKQGNADLNEYPDLLKKEDYYHILQVNGHYYSYFPIGASLIAVPFVVVADALIGPAINHFPQLGEAIRHRSHEPITSFDVISLRQPIELVVASFLTALSALFVYLFILQRTKRSSAALVGGLLFAFGTSLWSVASRGLWQHGPTILISAVVLYLLIRPNPGKWRFLGIGLLLGFSLIIRPTNAIPTAFVLGYILVEHRRYWWIYVLGVLAMLLPFMGYSWSIYHTPLPPYYSASRLLISSSYGEALLGNLISPARGLFIFSPFLLLAAISTFRRRRVLTRLEIFAGLIILFHWLAISTPRYWWGGHTYGPRYFSDVLPYLFLLLIPTLQELFGQQRLRVTWASALFVVCIAWSVFVHAQGALNWNAYLWNTHPTNVDQDPARIWRWSDVQFFR